MIVDLPSKETNPEFLDDSDQPPPYTILSDSEDTAVEVNHVFITLNKHLSGTFHINPDLPSPYTQGQSSDTQKCSRKVPNASFRTTERRTISLKLAVTGSTTNMTDISKATVTVTSQNGNINLNLLPGHPAKRINLEVHSQGGSIVLMVPKNFQGAIRLRTRLGSLNFLPAFESVMKILKSDGKAALVLVGDTASLGDTADPNYCELKSILGKITVGVIGEDIYVPEPGIWKKLSEFVRSVGIKQSLNEPS